MRGTCTTREFSMSGTRSKVCFECCGMYCHVSGPNVPRFPISYSSTWYFFVWCLTGVPLYMCRLHNTCGWQLKSWFPLGNELAWDFARPHLRLAFHGELRWESSELASPGDPSVSVWQVLQWRNETQLKDSCCSVFSVFFFPPFFFSEQSPTRSRCPFSSLPGFG